MKNTILIICLICISFYGLAQNTFKEGYYITNTKDTVYGLIKDYDLLNSPNQLEFKTSISSSEKILRPEDVLGFVIDGIIKYKSAKVEIDVSSDDISKLSYNSQPELETQHLFLKVLEEGNANLYKYKNDVNYRYFFKTDTEDLQMLVFKKYYYENNLVKKNNYFRQQLFNSLKCEDLSKPDFTDLEYEEGDLRKIISKYNECSGESTYSFKKQKAKHSFFISIRPGIRLNSFTTDGLDGKIDYDSKVTFSVGLELEYVLPINNNKWSLVLEPTYFQDYSTIKEGEIDRFQNRQTIYEVNYSSIEFPFGLRYYMYFNNESQLFLNSGFTLNLDIGDNIIIRNRGSDLELESIINPYLGVGYRFKEKFSLEFRYQTGRDLLSKYTARSSNFSSSSLILGYRFL